MKLEINLHGHNFALTDDSDPRLDPAVTLQALRLFVNGIGNPPAAVALDELTARLDAAAGNLEGVISNGSTGNHDTGHTDRERG